MVAFNLTKQLVKDKYVLNERIGKLSIYKSNPNIIFPFGKSVERKISYLTKGIEYFEKELEKKKSGHNILTLLMEKKKEVRIIQNKGSKELYFSNEMNTLFHELIDAMLYDCIINNPDNWYIFEKPEDFDLNIQIKTNFSDDPAFFESFQKIRSFTLKNREIIPNLNNYYSKMSLFTFT